MVSVPNNSVNLNMKNPDLHVGVITPPDSHYKPVLYSDREASAKFNAMNADIYSKQKKLDFEDTKDTPKSVKYIAATGGSMALAYAVECFITRKA